jgi:hypothetical protein
MIDDLRHTFRPLFEKDLARLDYYERFVPLDHYYSPMVASHKLGRTKYEKLKTSKVLDIDLRDEDQLVFLNKMIERTKTIPWKDQPSPNLKYHFMNDAFSYHDAITYLNILLEYKSKRVIEIGSGFSSCALYDVDQMYFSGKVDKTFIEPYPGLLKKLLSQELNFCKVIERRVEDLDGALFENLDQNDILFVDSTHISKYDSDINFIMFEILPRLKKGVLIHFHDVFTNFEYPYSWLNEGRCWNESYIIRAFLMNNPAYKIIYFNDYMSTKYQEIYKSDFPLALRNRGGSLWLQKL